MAKQRRMSSTRKATKAKGGSSFHSKPAKKSKKAQNWETVRKTSGSVRIVNKETGLTKVLLTPHGKSKKYCLELKTGEHVTNDGKAKNKRLTDTEAAWRSGYLTAQADSAKAFKAKHPNYTRKTR